MGFGETSSNDDPQKEMPSLDGEAVGSVLSRNRAAWDNMVDSGDRFTQPASDEDFNNPLGVVDGCGWLGGDIRGRRVLCLAAGGGRQGPLYAAAGADVTVVDLSDKMLGLDRLVAAERNLSIRTVMTSMDDLQMFADQAFDIVIHPVSTCYLPRVEPVYRQIARVLRPAGLYISQHKQPTSLQVAQRLDAGRWVLQTPYYTAGPLPPGIAGSLVREKGTAEYLHRWEDLVGGLCRAGFVIEDLREPCHARQNPQPGSFAHHSSFAPPYVRIKARRLQQQPLLVV